MFIPSHYRNRAKERQLNQNNESSQESILLELKKCGDSKQGSDRQLNQDSRDAEAYVNSISGDMPLEFKSETAKAMYSLLMQPQSEKKSILPVKTDVFAGGRMLYEWDMFGKGKGSSYTSDAPNCVLKSRPIVSVQEKKESVLSLPDLLHLLLQSKNHTHHTHIEQVQSKNSIRVESLDQRPSPIIEEDEEDIFADVGREYVLEIQELDHTQSKNVEQIVQKYIQQDQIQEDSGPLEIQSILLESKKMADLVTDNQDALKEPHEPQEQREDTDMIDLDSDAEDYGSSFGTSGGSMSKTRLDFKSDAEWNTYKEAASFMTGFGRQMPSASQSVPRKSMKKGKRSHPQQLDKQLNALDKVYEGKYGVALKDKKQKLK